MAGIPREKQLTRRQIERKVKPIRLLLPVFGRRMMGLDRRPAGRELFLDTEAGRVRVLAYGLDRPERLPLFVNIHGGGFILGRPEMDDRFMPPIASQADVKILSIDYSLSPEVMFPVALNECYGVVKYAKAHADELGIAADRIGVGGHSAGGNLSAGICLLDAGRRELGLRCAVLDYPPLDLYTDPYLKPRPKKAIPPRSARIYDAAYVGSREAAKNPLVSPYYAAPEALRAFPPTLIITAGNDSLAPEAGAFKDRLIEAGVPVTFRHFEGARHGFTHFGDPEAGEAWRSIIDFLERHLA